MIAAFWQWYERTYAMQLGIAAFLFLLQLAHLVWLFGEVVWAFLTGHPLFVLTGFPKVVIIFADYLEIPALLSVSLVYINELRKRWNTKDLLFLLFLNSQWLHLFWITDEFVQTAFSGAAMGTVLPLWLAWVAVGIDYLELPVMYDTAKKFVGSLRRVGGVDRI